MRRLRLRLALLAALVLAVALPSGARAFTSQCPYPASATSSPVYCLPDVRVPGEALQSGDSAATGYLAFPSGGFYPAYSFAPPTPATGPGRFGNAFTFSTPTDGLTFDPGGPGNNHDHISPAQATVAAWVKATSPGSSRSIVVRGARGCGTYSGAFGLVTGPQGGLQFYATLNDPINPPGFTTVRTPEVPASSIWDGSWHAIAGVYDGGAPASRRVVSLWIDGRQASAQDFPGYLTAYQGDTTLAYPSASGDDQLMIARGSTNQGPPNCGSSPPLNFTGSIDEVELFHAALTATQIAFLQDAGAGSGPSGEPDVPYTPVIQGPAISGTPKVGQQLTCTDRDGLTGDFPAGPSYTWERAPRATHFENDASWFPIAGASGTHYTVQDADAGSVVRCHEYGTATQGSVTLAADRASASLRADTDVPQSSTLPTVTGTPVAGNTLTCHPGTWTNGPDPSAYVYQWVKNGAIFTSHGSDPSKWVLTHTWDGARLVNPQGDGGTTMTCRVIAKNDVGYSAPAVSTDLEHVVDGAPFRLADPTATVSRGAPDDFDPLHSVAHCNPGSWRDDYARIGVPGYGYRYQWYRVFSNPAGQSLIAGATEADYHPRVEDLGRDVRCRITVPNVGFETSTFTNTARIGLPNGPVDSTTFREPGRNGADPTSLLALNNNYAQPIEQQVIDHLNAGLKQARSDCDNGVGLPKGARIPGSAPNPGSVPYTPSGSGLDPVLRCQILLHASPDQIIVNFDSGVRYRKPGCVPTPAGTTNLQGQVIHPLCPSLGIEIPAVNPTHPPTGGNLGGLAGVQPKLIIWDLDNNGTADAICPGSAPVLRTILDPNQWHARAVIITDETAKTGVYHFAQANFDNSVHYPAPPGKLRANQVRVCSTSYDPPPDPAQAPCATSADFGHVHLVGNLCPVAVRALDKTDYEDLLGAPEFKQLKAFMLAASEDQLKNENGVTQTQSVRRPPSTVTWAKWPASSPRDVPSDAQKVVASTNANIQAALSAQGSPLGYDAPDLPHVNNVPGLVDAKNAFAFQQVLVTRDAVGVNGVTQDPIHGTGALLVPSDVKDALPNQDQMVLAGRDVASHLGLPSADGLPLATGGLLNAQLSDVPTNANDVIRETNIGQLRDQLQSQGTARAKDLLSKLDLGPFKLLSGAVKVHAQDDGSATVEADVTLPGLATSPDKKGDLTIHATLHGDLDGRIALRGLHLHQPDAYLGALHLHNLGLDYDSNQGLTVTGAILFPPADDGLTIRKFQLGPDGGFRALEVDYKQSPGIDIGPGAFLTTLGGGLDLPKQTIDAHAVVAAGPAAGRCAAATLDGRASVFFGSPFSIDAGADVSLVCIPVGHLTVHADATGLFSVHASANFDVGPIYAYAALGGDIRAGRHAAWQVTADGKGGIRDLLSAEIHAVLSNAGLAGCGRIQLEVPLIGKFLSLFSKHPKHVTIDLAGGASVDFVDDLPPITLPALLANLHLFLGCDISAYRTVTHAVTPRGVTSGGYSFTVQRNAGASLFSLEGAGATPLVKLRSPSGRVFDLTDAVKGKSFGHAAWGKVVNSENRAVLLVGDPQAGTWTAQTASGAASVVRVRQASILPKPAVQARVSGRGTRRTLRYTVQPVSGQVVRLFEMARHGEQLLRTVHTGGHGRLRFTVSEASGTHRRIVAEVEQDGLPRANLTVARFLAPSPRVGRVPHVHVRRRGRNAVVSWGRTYFARSYLVTARYGDGRNVPLPPRRGARHVLVPRVGRGVGVRVSVRGVSPAGRPGRRSYATLRGNMRVGFVRHLPLHHKKKKTTKKKHPPKKHHAAKKHR